MSSGFSALAALALMAVHLLAAREPLRSFARGRRLSFAGGAAAAYVFLYILPIINRMASEVPGEDARWADGEWIFVATLAGTCLYHAAQVYGRHKEADSGPLRTLRQRLNLAAFALYNLLIGALLVLKPYANGVDALVHQMALGLHFAVLGVTLRERDPDSYDRFGRWVMVASVAAGWAIGTLDLLPTSVMGLAFAFLAGGMILNVLKEEMSQLDDAGPLPFLAGAASFAVLFLAARGVSL